MIKGIKKYRIKRVSFSRYVLQEWCIWFPFWMQVDMTRYQFIDKIVEPSASKKNTGILNSYFNITIRHHRIATFILAVILLFITGCNVQKDNSTSNNKATGNILTRKYMVPVKFSGNQTNHINISAILESYCLMEADKRLYRIRSIPDEKLNNPILKI